MKRGTKFTVFVASMAITIGSLVTFIGPRHCHQWNGHNTGACYEQGRYHNQGCGDWKEAPKDDAAGPAPEKQAQ